MEWLVQWERIFWGLHILGVVFGLGAATVTDVLFVDFMRSFRVERREEEIMELLSKVVWVGIVLLVISGILLVVPRWEMFLASDRFLMKMTAVAVVILNGVFLNLWIQPRARKISFVKGREEARISEEEEERRGRLRKGAFALGGISFVSWYGAFGLAVLDMITLSYLSLLGLFVLGLVIAVGASQWKERKYREEVKEKPGEELLA